MVNTIYYHLNYLRDIFHLPSHPFKITYNTGQTTALPRELPLCNRIIYFTQLITADNVILSVQAFRQNAQVLLLRLLSAEHAILLASMTFASFVLLPQGIHKPHLWLQKVSTLILNFQLPPFCCLSVGKNLDLPVCCIPRKC